MSFRGAPRSRGTGANFGGGGGRGGGFGGRGGGGFGGAHSKNKITLQSARRLTGIGRGGFQQRDNGPPADVLGRIGMNRSQRSNGSEY
jgi:H/ACA ribonucleoprotein complex subunit 1